MPCRRPEQGRRRTEHQTVTTRPSGERLAGLPSLRPYSHVVGPFNTELSCECTTRAVTGGGAKRRHPWFSPALDSFNSLLNGRAPKVAPWVWILCPPAFWSVRGRRAVKGRDTGLTAGGWSLERRPTRPEQALDRDIGGQRASVGAHRQAAGRVHAARDGHERGHAERGVSLATTLTGA